MVKIKTLIKPIKYLVEKPIQYYKKNGLVGAGYNTISQLRGGQNNDNIKIPHTRTEETKQFIDNILTDKDISESVKKTFRRLREDSIFTDSDKLKYERLKNSLIAKARHPRYSKIKGKLPYVILSPFTFAELNRLAGFRMAGFSSAPISIGAVVGFSLPCAVTFSMLEMYAPDKVKFPCKCAKWAGGAVFYGVCAGVDSLSGGLENKFFGEELPFEFCWLLKN